MVKLQGQFGQTLGQLTIALAVLAFKICTAAHKAVVGFLHQHLVFLVMTRCIKMLMDILHALPQLLVEGDAIEMLAQHGRHTFAHCHQFIIGIGRQHRIEYAQHTVERTACAVQCHDGVLKRSLSLIAGDGFDLGIMLLNTLTDGRLIVCSGNAVKRYRPTRRLERLEKYVVHFSPLFLVLRLIWYLVS